jgi:hypothetical protein
MVVEKRTRRFVRYTTPDLQCCEYASCDDCVLVVCSESVVRVGDWYSVCSPGRGVYPPSPLSASITQLFLRSDLLFLIFSVRDFIVRCQNVLRCATLQASLKLRASPRGMMNRVCTTRKCQEGERDILT